MGEIAERFMRHAANVDQRRYNVRELVDVSQFDAEKRSLYAAIAELERQSDWAEKPIIFGDLVNARGADLTIEDMVEAQEECEGTSGNPAIAKLRALADGHREKPTDSSSVTWARNASLADRLAAAEARAERAERDNAILHGPQTADVHNRGSRPRILSVAVFELDAVTPELMERRALEIVAAGEALLAEYSKRKAAEEAATSEVLR